MSTTDRPGDSEPNVDERLRIDDGDDDDVEDDDDDSDDDGDDGDDDDDDDGAIRGGNA
jgi:hypothetical protein